MKAKKKSVKKHGLHHHEASLRALVALIILFLAFGILLLFNTYSTRIISAGAFQIFIVLTCIGMGLLLALLFLVNPVSKKK